MKRLDKSGLRTCCSCAQKELAKRTNCDSQRKGGLIGGKKNAELGHLKNANLLAHTPEATRKRFETLKKNGSLYESKPEKEFYKCLVSEFGVDDVIHHIMIKKFRIDFYVKTINTYIQFDGEYWHGLNVPYNQLIGTPKLKYDRDRKCDEYCNKHNIKLIRITDKQFEKQSFEELLKLIKSYE